MIKLMIVEDNEQNLYMLSVLLKGHGYEVISAINGVDALKKARINPPDVIISDILMPEMDGFTLCRQWKADDRLKNIPFIFYTATYTDPRDEKLAMSLGAERFLLKPIDPGELVGIIKDIVQDVKGRQPDVKSLNPDKEKEIFKLYNERLVKKLEKKMLDLEKEITDRKSIEKALRLSESRYRNLFDNINDCIFTHDLAGCLITANHATARMLEYEEELSGRRISDFLHPESAQFFHSTYTPQIERDGFYNGKWVYISGKGAERHIEVRSVLVEQENEEKYVSCVGRDITESIAARRKVKNLEQQLFQAQKMEAIGTLAGGIAHDFNNILSAISGHTELALMGIPEQIEGREHLESVMTACDRAIDLVRQILTFSRHTEQEKRPVNLSLIVKEVIKLLRASLPAFIDIKLDLKTEQGIIEANPSQIHQVLMNLATNAGHAMGDKSGILGIGLSNLDIDSASAGFYPDLLPGPHLRLTVSDTGHGIPAENMARIFDPYFTTKEKEQGTGLGLSVAHGIIKSCKGAISVYSEPGRGSAFHIYLPRVTPDGHGLSLKTMEPPLTGEGWILFVDDEQILIDIGKQMLERLGYEVLTRTGSYDALELFRQQPDQIDLVITNMTMPNMTGDKLAQQLMEIRPDILIILCTGFSEMMTEKRAKDMGIHAFIMKPFNFHELAKTVHRVLMGK